MRENKARRLSVRVPAIGWQAHISNHRVKNKKVTVANFSADGAYLISKEKYPLYSQVTLSFRSPDICFSVNGMVVRSDSYGIAVRFIDCSEASRTTLLRVISQYLYKNMPKRSSVEKTQTSRPRQSLVAETTGCSESRGKPPFDVEQACSTNSTLSAAVECRGDASLAESSSNSTEDNRFMISPGQTQSAESLKVFLSHCGNATVKCPFCTKGHYTSVPKHFHNKAVRARCECGHSFPVLFDNRRTYRKEVQLPGEYWNSGGVKHLMTITTLSVGGAGFTAGGGKPSVNSGEAIQLKFLLKNRHNVWIESEAIVKRVDGNQIGVEFVNLSEHQRKCLGFYLMA